MQVTLWHNWSSWSLWPYGKIDKSFSSDEVLVLVVVLLQLWQRVFIAVYSWENVRSGAPEINLVWAIDKWSLWIRVICWLSRKANLIDSPPFVVFEAQASNTLKACIWGQFLERSPLSSPRVLSLRWVCYLCSMQSMRAFVVNHVFELVLEGRCLGQEQPHGKTSRSFWRLCWLPASS